MGSKRIRILFAGGGTGGHLYPAVAIAGEVRNKQPDADITFVGTKGKIEASVVPPLGYRFETIWISGFRRSLSAESILFPLKVVVSLVQSFSLLRSFRPHAVVGTGGYVSGPVLFAATLMGIPTLIQEQNSYPGVTTRLLASRVREVHLSFGQSERYFRKKENLRTTGNPTRAVVGTVGREEGRRFLNLDTERKALLVFGGSQGAHSINAAVLDVLEQLIRNDVQVIWQTGERDYEDVRAGVEKSASPVRVKMQKFIERMEYAYGACDLALCRSGATTVAELTRAGVPSILVPYPHAAADHQTENARAMADAGAAVLLKEVDLKDKMLAEIRTLLGDPARLKSMSDRARALGKPDAAAKLAESVLRLAESHDGGGR